MKKRKQNSTVYRLKKATPQNSSEKPQQKVGHSFFSESRDIHEDRGTRQFKTEHLPQTFPSNKSREL